MSNEKGSKYFTYNEIKCKCGQCDGGQADPLFLKRIDILRDMFGAPLVSNSCIRCKDWNSAIKGSRESGHLYIPEGRKACAMDIRTTNMTGAEKLHLLQCIVICNFFNGIGIAATYIHVDTKPRKALWTY